MKNTIKPFLMASLISLAALPAFGQWGRFYAGADAGGTVMEDADLREFFGPVTPNSKIAFDPGFRFGGVFGYRVTEWFSAEGQIAYYGNEIKSITDSTSHDAWFYNLPFLANVRFQVPRARLSPYIGGGVGFSTVILDAHDIEVNGIFMHGSDADTVFAYQGFAGLRFAISYNMGLSVEYRYFHADPAEWHADVTFGTQSNRIRFGDTETHSLSLAFDYRF